MQKRILIVDDELEMRNLLSICLKPQGYVIEEAVSGYEALQKVMDRTYDLIILDIMMPTVDGFEVLKKIREAIDEELPVILLTALGESEKVVEGLQTGADDYITKPFEPRELVARIESVLRRVNRDTKKEQFRVHDLQFDLEKMKVAYRGMTIPFTKKEFNLLSRLATNTGRVYSREHLLELEWDDHYGGDTRTVDAHIKNIREKLKQVNFEKRIIETVWGIGYQMIEEGCAYK
ncbi:response regulator transcription factor [Desertibacillus haloalkaliphilus]|uniref:response regulator transcription factor n=1 Tax=Desertibacillus haloalkaliphilus TaxID=1328930 RepID=UPI001C260C39|nr:response regulator transcription factor [Desertibacillus haloalkaliphilus]MBU8908025.1 response regulator transcription factor [Desertibacillus haloalkaliphilus]